VNKNKAFILLFLITLLSRIPFLGNGYGVEEDSWGTAVAAYHYNTSGIYETSRLPGHPVQDVLYAILWHCGPWWFNFITALFSAFAVTYFALFINKIGIKHFFLPSLAFAFCPVVYVSSCYTIDYMWAMGFLMAACYYSVSKKPIIFALLLSLAIGCRITTGAMLLPIFLFLYDSKKSVLTNFIQFSSPVFFTLLFSSILYIPIIKTYGWNFMVYYDQFPPSLAKLIYKGSIGVFGLIGLIGLIVAIVYTFLRRKEIKPFQLYFKPLSHLQVISIVATILLFVINYLQLPQKSAYLITAIPFIIMLCSFYMNKTVFNSLCLTFFVSSFICSINLTDKYRGATYSSFASTYTVSGQEIFFDPLSGPIFSDYSKRKNKLAFTNEVIGKSLSISKKTIIISGWWYNQLIIQQLNQKQNPLISYIDYMDEKSLIKSVSEECTILYLPEQEKNNDVMYNIKNTQNYATAMFKQ
jgi:hypothetical protein